MATADLFDTRTMLMALEQVKMPKRFLLDTFFQATEQSTTRYVDIDIWKGKRRMAPFVSPRNEAKAVERIGFTTRTYQPPYVKPKMVFTGIDLLKKELGATIYQGGKTPQQIAAEILGKDLSSLQEMIVRREEWMAASALNGGTITVTGDGINDTLDFLMNSTHKITLSGTARWGQSAADIITNLRTWRRLIAQDSGLVPDVAIFAHDVVDTFLKDATVQKFLVQNFQNIVGQIDVSDIQASGAEYVATLFGTGLKIFAYNEWYVDDNGTEQAMVPTGKVFLGSTRARTARHYGLIQDLQAGGAAVPYFPKSWEEEDPSARFIMLQSAPLIVPHQIDAFATASVL